MKYSSSSIPFIFSLFLFANATNAQTVYFAKDVKPSGEMIGQNTKFNFPKGENDLKMLVKLGHKVNADTAIFKVYRVAKGERYLDQTIKSPIKPEWFWFPEDVLIRGQGKYLVEVYARGGDAIIATGNFTLEWVKP